jgi:hypothetical protein
MEFYYFGGFIDDKQVSNIEDHHFSGILFTYDIDQGDFFTKVARHIDLTKKIKYMIALRPYSISPQYLFMINDSIQGIMSNRLEINLISGHIKEHEKNKGGIIGSVTDASSNIERSNYLIEYIKVIDQMKKSGEYRFTPDYYISTSNEYVFDVAKQLNNKMIIQYSDYIRGYWNNYTNYGTNNIRTTRGPDFDLSGQQVIISMAPVLRKTKEEVDKLRLTFNTTDTAHFSYDELEIFIEKLKKDGINNLMFIAWPPEEKEHFMDFVKYYKEKNKSID